MLSNCDLVSNVSPLLIFCRYQMKCKSVSNVSPRYSHQTLPNKARRYEIYVIRVLDSPTPSTRREKAGPPPVSKRRVGNGDRSMANELWNRLCSNRNAGKILKKKEDEDDGT